MPREVGLQPLDASLKPDEKGISCCMRGYSNYVQILSQFECSKNLLEPTEDQSAFSFHAARPVQVCGNGPAFHNENSMPPAVCILDLGCARALGSRKAFEAFCSMLAHIQTVSLWYEIQPTSSRFFFENVQQSKCTGKLVIFIYDHGWNTQFTELGIVEEGDVPLFLQFLKMRKLDSNSSLLQTRPTVLRTYWHENCASIDPR